MSKRVGWGPEMAFIELSRNAVCLCDRADFHFLSRFSWSLGSNRYAVATLLAKDGVRRSFPMHRVILGLLYTDKEHFVDHINHDSLDNRRSNIRIATASQNRMNIKKLPTALSPYKGVFFDSSKKKFIARIGLNGRNIKIGVFTNAEEAGFAYNEKAVELFGEFACLNELKTIESRAC